MIHDPWSLVAAILAVLVGTTLQRISGAGVGLVVSPVFVLLFGPAVGVFAANSLTIVSAALMMTAVWPRIEWGKAARVLLFGAPGAVLGAFLVLWLPSAWLSIIIGAIVLSAVLITRFSPTLPHWDNTPTLGVASFVAGSFNTTAGVAAPALVVYSRLSKWEQARMSATLQPIFLGFGVMSVLLKTAVGASGFAEAPPWWALPLIVVLVLAGIRIGGALSKRVSHEGAQRLAMVLAGLGGAGAIARGVVQLAVG